MTPQAVEVATKFNDLQAGESMIQQHMTVPAHLQVQLNKDIAEYLTRIDPDTKRIFVSTIISVKTDIVANGIDYTI